MARQRDVAGQPTGQSLSAARAAMSEYERAASRAGVWTRRRACQMFGESRVRAQVAARRWSAPLPSVIVAHNGPLTLEQRRWVALLAAPRGALFGGLTAAELDGFRGFAPAGITLLIPASSYRPRLEVLQDWNVELRWSTLLGPDDVNPMAVPPRTRRARSIVNAASERIVERRARVLVLAAVQQGFTRPADVSAALGRLGRCRNRRIIIESVRDAEGGIQSLPEHEFETIRRRRRLPPPTRQQVLRHNDGRYYLDNDWPTFGVRVEIHGIPHMEVRSWDSDLLRQNDLSIGGGGLLIFSSYAIRHERDRVERQLEQMFRSRGWRA